MKNQSLRNTTTLLSFPSFPRQYLLLCPCFLGASREGPLYALARKLHSHNLWCAKFIPRSCTPEVGQILKNCPMSFRVSSRTVHRAKELPRSYRRDKETAQGVAQGLLEGQRYCPAGCSIAKELEEWLPELCRNCLMVCHARGAATLSTGLFDWQRNCRRCCPRSTGTA